MGISVVTPNNYHRCNQTDNVNNTTGSDSVVAKEEERSEKGTASTVQQSSNGKRKDTSITSNVHLLQEELDENKEERKKNEPSIELHDHNGTKSPQLVSSKNGDIVHATKKQKQHHQNSFIINHIAKFQKIVEYASHRLQEETLGLQEEPSVIEINNLHLLQEELHAPSLSTICKASPIGNYMSRVPTNCHFITTYFSSHIHVHHHLWRTLHDLSPSYKRVVGVNHPEESTTIYSS